MAYRFEGSEDVSTNIRRIASERIDSAIKSLQKQGEERHEGVHDARKRFKEIRAVLRLVRAEMGGAYGEENVAFRDLGRRLSGARDAQALIETFDKLDEHYPHRLNSRALRLVRGRLLKRLSMVAEDEAALDDTIPSVIAELKRIKKRVKDWPLDQDGFDAIAPGLHKGYRDGRRSFKAAYAEATDEDFHEWRKRIKDQWYHTKLLRPIWEEGMAGRQSTLKSLSDCIGDDHDLSVMRAVIRAEPEVFGAARNADLLDELAVHRQQALRQQGRGLGLRLYAEKPAAFTARMGRYWRAWCEEVGPGGKG